MRRLSIPAAILLLLVHLPVDATAQAGGPPASRPNIVWISNEDMSPRLGVYGYASSGNVADPASEREVLFIDQPGFGHKGGTLVFDADGPINNTLRFPDECVRHKLLDLVGDLALAGCDLVGSFVAFKSGHRLNAELVRVLLAEGERIRGRRRSA